MAKTRARAPQHRLDHIPKFVPLDDPGWDGEIMMAALRDPDATVELESGEVVSLYPLHRYARGMTRYDLGEPGLREVVSKTGCLDLEKAEVWTLRVLAFDARLNVFQLEADGDRNRAHIVAFAHGVVGLKTPEDDESARAAVKAIEKLPKERTAAVISSLYEAVASYRLRALGEVGFAISQLSSDLSEDERRV